MRTRGDRGVCAGTEQIRKESEYIGSDTEPMAGFYSNCLLVASKYRDARIRRSADSSQEIPRKLLPKFLSSARRCSPHARSEFYAARSPIQDQGRPPAGASMAGVCGASGPHYAAVRALLDACHLPPPGRLRSIG